MPSFVFSTPERSSSSELFLRNTTGAIFGGEDLARIFSYDLFFGKTQYVLRAEVPVGDNAIHIGHKNRIVSDIFDSFAVNVFGSAIYDPALSGSGHDLNSLVRYEVLESAQQK